MLQLSWRWSSGGDLLLVAEMVQRGMRKLSRIVSFTLGDLRGLTFRELAFYLSDK